MIVYNACTFDTYQSHIEIQNSGFRIQNLKVLQNSHVEIPYTDHDVKICKVVIFLPL